MNPYEKYQERMVDTMTQGDLLMMLYDEIVKQIELARAAIDAGKIEEMDKALVKAGRIVRYLNGALDHRYDISGNLAQLYSFFDTQLVMANVKKSKKYLDDIEPLILELRDTFDQCDKLNRAGRVNRSAGDAV